MFTHEIALKVLALSVRNGQHRLAIASRNEMLRKFSMTPHHGIVSTRHGNPRVCHHRCVLDTGHYGPCRTVKYVDMVAQATALWGDMDWGENRRMAGENAGVMRSLMPSMLTEYDAGGLSCHAFARPVEITEVGWWECSVHGIRERKCCHRAYPGRADSGEVARIVAPVDANSRHANRIGVTWDADIEPIILPVHRRYGMAGMPLRKYLHPNGATMAFPLPLTPTGRKSKARRNREQFRTVLQRGESVSQRGVLPDITLKRASEALTPMSVKKHGGIRANAYRKANDSYVGIAYGDAILKHGAKVSRKLSGMVPNGTDTPVARLDPLGRDYKRVFIVDSSGEVLPVAKVETLASISTNSDRQLWIMAQRAKAEAIASIPAYFGHCPWAGYNVTSADLGMENGTDEPILPPVDMLGLSPITSGKHRAKFGPMSYTAPEVAIQHRKVTVKHRVRNEDGRLEWREVERIQPYVPAHRLNGNTDRATARNIGRNSRLGRALLQRERANVIVTMDIGNGPKMVTLMLDSAGYVPMPKVNKAGRKPTGMVKLTNAQKQANYRARKAGKPEPHPVGK